MPEKRSPHIHPEDRARINALNTVARLSEGSPKSALEISYYSPELIQCTLPHSDPKVNPWIKKNGSFTLIVSSGFDREGKPYGIPYGSVPRLVLAYIITQVFKTGERHVELGKHFTTFLKKIGYTGNHRGNSRGTDTLRRSIQAILSAHIAFERHEGDVKKGSLERNMVNVASSYTMWWDYTEEEREGEGWTCNVTLSEDFFGSIMRAPVPLRTDILADIRKSPLAIDVYMWLSYRLFTMQATGVDEISLSYGMLQDQFGTGIGTDNYRLFRFRFRAALKMLEKYWTTPDGKCVLHYDLGEGRFTLYRSALLIGKSKSAEPSTTAKLILSEKKFDDMTRKRARVLAPNWDVRYLESQYFEWLEKESITPKQIKAHFLAFVKAHLERNGAEP